MELGCGLFSYVIHVLIGVFSLLQLPFENRHRQRTGFSLNFKRTVRQSNPLCILEPSTIALFISNCLHLTHKNVRGVFCYPVF